MKFFHLGDLHLGKKVNGFSMLNDQRHILKQVVTAVQKYKPDGIFIAGDVYDKGVPPGEAVELLDAFLTCLWNEKVDIYFIAGNHDSPERLAFASQLLQKNNIYIAGTLQEQPIKITKEDDYGIFHIHLLPFLKPATVAPFLEEKPTNTEQAMKMMLEKIPINKKERNILVAHQFVTKGGMAQQSDSETQFLGGTGEIDYQVFDAFDYVALGHLHSPQKVGRDTIRYAGSPLKYSFSELSQKKAITVVECKEKGDISLEQIPLYPLHSMREIRGPLLELIKAGLEEETDRQDYIHAIVTDEEELIDAIGRLRSVYPNIMLLDFDNTKTRHQIADNKVSNLLEKLSPMQLFSEFFERQNGSPLSEKEYQFMEKLLMKQEEIL